MESPTVDKIYNIRTRNALQKVGNGTRDIKIKRYKIIIDYDETYEDLLEDLLNALEDLDKVKEYIFVFEKNENVWFMLLEYEKAERLSTLILFFKKYVDIDDVTFKIMSGQKQKLINAFVKVGLQQSTIPNYYAKNEISLIDIF
jgi:hypothetical protein